MGFIRFRNRSPPFINFVPTGRVILPAGLSFKLFRILVTNRPMPPLPVIKGFDVLEDVRARFHPCPIRSPMHPFPFEQGKETFRYGIIIAIPCATHAACDALIP